MVVEFFGLPGSGKTSVARALVESMGERGSPVVFLQSRPGESSYRVERILGGLSHTARHPLRATFDARAILRTEQRSIRELASVWLNWQFKARLAVHGASCDGTVVLDEGPVHAMWSIAFSARAHGPLEGLVLRLEELFSVDWALVEVQTDDQRVLARLGRGARGGRLDREVAGNPEAVMDRAHRSTACVRQMIDRLKETHGLNLRRWTVRNEDGPPGTAAEQVLELLGGWSRAHQ